MRMYFQLIVYKLDVLYHIRGNNYDHLMQNTHTQFPVVPNDIKVPYRSIIFNRERRSFDLI